jgi:hypothetical protein
MKVADMDIHTYQPQLLSGDQRKPLVEEEKGGWGICGKEAMLFFFLSAISRR